MIVDPPSAFRKISDDYPTPRFGYHHHPADTFTPYLELNSVVADLLVVNYQ